MVKITYTGKESIVRCCRRRVAFPLIDDSRHFQQHLRQFSPHIPLSRIYHILFTIIREQTRIQKYSTITIYMPSIRNSINAPKLSSVDAMETGLFSAVSFLSLVVRLSRPQCSSVTSLFMPTLGAGVVRGSRRRQS